MNNVPPSPVVTPARAIEILEAQIAEVRKAGPLSKVAKAELALGTAVAILRALEHRQSQVIELGRDQASKLAELAFRVQALELAIGADTDV